MLIPLLYLGDFEVNTTRSPYHYPANPLLTQNYNSEITRRIDEAKRKMGRVMQIAAFSLAEVTYAVGGSNITYQIQESVKSARFRLRTKQENVSGVFLPQFESFTTNDAKDDFGLTGLGKGGQQVQRCRETYRRAVETLVELASLQTAFVTLDEVIKVVNRRVNAIEHVIIPRTENTIKCEIFPPRFIQSIQTARILGDSHR